MPKKFLAGLLILTFALTFRHAAFAQDKSDNSQKPVQDWQALLNLRPNTVIVVNTRQGKEFEGPFVDLKGSTLGLASGFNILDFEQSDIEEVRQKPSRRKGRIIGTVVGFLVGAMIGASLDTRIDDRARANGPPYPDSFATLTGVGGFGGGAVGYTIGRRLDNRKGKLLFKSK